MIEAEHKLLFKAVADRWVHLSHAIAGEISDREGQRSMCHASCRRVGPKRELPKEAVRTFNHDMCNARSVQWQGEQCTASSIIG